MLSGLLWRLFSERIYVIRNSEHLVCCSFEAHHMRKIAVIDIGSNSARIVVMQRSGRSGLFPVTESRVTLKLQRELIDSANISAAGIEKIIRVVNDFAAVSRSAEADVLVAVATSAIRDSTNADEVVDRVKTSTGVALRVLTGQEEAHLTFRGALSTLPIVDGAIIDLGGGSMELVQFRGRQPISVETLPLGTLRLSDRFQVGSSATKETVGEIVRYVSKILAQVGVERNASECAVVVGTGGTIRNAAQVLRRRAKHRFARLHGHELASPELQDLQASLIGLTSSQLRNVHGLNPERADTFVSGMAIVNTTLEYLGADSVLVADSGLREGVALEALGSTAVETGAIALDSVMDMCARFSTWSPERAERRARIAGTICAEFANDIGGENSEAVVLASVLVDAGSSIDYRRRYEMAAILIEHSNAGALTHRQVALVSAICKAADETRLKLNDFGGHIQQSELDDLACSGVLLRLADEIEMRVVNGMEQTVNLHREGAGKISLQIAFRGSSNWQPKALQKHFQTVFHGELEVS